MIVIDRECVRRLWESPDPDATLVFIRGDCRVLPAAQIDEAHRGLIIARRKDLAALVTGDTLTDEQLDFLAHRLDNIVRDLGA